MASAINPLPSLLRASAHDAGNFSMRNHGRAAWNDDDWNAMCDTQERLIAGCYGFPTDTDPSMKYIRFSIAESWDKQGQIGLWSNWAEVMALIETAFSDPA